MDQDRVGAADSGMPPATMREPDAGGAEAGPDAARAELRAPGAPRDDVGSDTPVVRDHAGSDTPAVRDEAAFAAPSWATGDVASGTPAVRDDAGTGVLAGATRDEAGSGTPGALLAAARKLFAEHGFEGASVRAITAAAGANLGAVTYHFGSKKALYNRVVELCVSPLVGRVEAALAQPAPMLERLEGVIRAYFDHFAENPDLPQLMLQEIVLAGRPPEAASPFMRRIFSLIISAIREGQASGEVRPGDPVLMGMSLVSQPIFPMLARGPIQVMTGMDVADVHTRERVAVHVAAFARAGFAVRPEEVR